MREEILNIIKNKGMISTEDIVQRLNMDRDKIVYTLEALNAEEIIRKQDISGRKFWIINMKKNDQLKIWELMKQKGII